MISDKYASYARQMLVPGWGTDAQDALSSSTVFLAGAGGLGSACAMYLAAAGVGRLIVCDFDTVDISNLNRQIMHGESSLGREKTTSAFERLSDLNSRICIEPRHIRLDDTTIAEAADGADILIDCLDNLETRYVLNRYSVKKGIPMIHAGIQGMSGQITTIKPGSGPCLNCLFREVSNENSEDQEGAIPVVGAAVGVISSMQALEAIKLITGLGTPLIGRMIVYNGGEVSFHEISTSKDPECAVCGSGK